MGNAAVQHRDVEDSVLEARVHGDASGQASDLACAGGVTEKTHGGAQVVVDHCEVIHASRHVIFVTTASWDRRRSPARWRSIFRRSRSAAGRRGPGSSVCAWLL